MLYSCSSTTGRQIPEDETSQAIYVNSGCMREVRVWSKLNGS